MRFATNGLLFQEFKRNKKFYLNHVKLNLGQDYWFRYGFEWRLVKFIKVTEKGFNLLDIDNSKCIFKRHLYARQFVGKEIPKDKIRFKVGLPPWIDIIKDSSDRKQA